MSKKFTQRTDLYMYECMMQEIPTTCSIAREERIKGRFFGILNKFIEDNGFMAIHKRIVDTLKKFVFEEIPFKDAEHRDTFYKVYYKYKRINNKNADKTRTAVIYLLSANISFYGVLCKYLSGQRLSLNPERQYISNEESYDLYQAVKKLCGMKSGLYDEDLTEEGIIEDKTVCVIVMAMYLNKYGLNRKVSNSAK